MVVCGLHGRSLGLSNCMLSGTVPASLSVASSLTTGNFDVSNNQLAGVVPASLTAVYPSTSPVWRNNCIVNSTTSYAGCDLAERAALVELFSTTSGPTWTNGSDWLTAASPCLWFGVTCDLSQSKVL